MVWACENYSAKSKATKRILNSQGGSVVRPIDVSTNETHHFVNQHISSSSLRVLEVGCGNGELAKRLQDDGHCVIAIDSSEDAVANAKRIGVNATVAHWPNFADHPFDLILFTRALHHMHPLSPAVVRARELLKPGGLLLVEDFAFSDVHKQAAEWFYCLILLLDACGILVLKEGAFGTRILKGRGAFELWQDHVHEINSADSVLRAISREFNIPKTDSTPYFYRYLSEMVEDNKQGADVVSTALKLERLTGSHNTSFFLGRRLVAQNTNEN
jgi:SAM-dependent methyltransferase